MHFAQKVDFELSYSPFYGFSTKILLLQRGFPLTRFFPGPKNRVKGGVPVLLKLAMHLRDLKVISKILKDQLFLHGNAARNGTKGFL